MKRRKRWENRCKKGSSEEGERERQDRAGEKRRENK